MIDFSDIFIQSLQIILMLDMKYLEIIYASLNVSLIAVFIASTFSIVISAIISLSDFKFKTSLMIVINSLLALPPVVIGLVLYILFSTKGYFGAYNILYTINIMIIAQIILITPLMISLCKDSIDGVKVKLDEYLYIINCPYQWKVLTLIYECKSRIILNIIIALGRALSEVGAIIIVGGNIAHLTRTMTTGIVVETSKGDLAMALSLGLTLLFISLMINFIIFLLTSNLKNG
tara:strand:+ start:264 stop:962 length:699 start_codon:yes stop_codon:yes gene_type:complete